MSDTKPADQNAFPNAHSAQQPGLTRLDYFTAAALTGVLANPALNDLTSKSAAEVAVRAARHVLAELNGEDLSGDEPPAPPPADVAVDADQGEEGHDDIPY